MSSRWEPAPGTSENRPGNRPISARSAGRRLPFERTGARVGLPGTRRHGTYLNRPNMCREDRVRRPSAARTAGRGRRAALSWSNFCPKYLVAVRGSTSLADKTPCGADMGSRFDALYVLSPPLLFAAPVAVAARLRRTPIVPNLHDLYPQVAVDLGVLKNRFLIWAAERLEAFVYTSSAHILVAAPASLTILTETKRVVRGKLDVLWNFVDPGEWGPQTVENAFRLRHSLTGRFVVMYAGQLGLAQDLDVMLECARQTVHDRDWRYIVVGDGRRLPRGAWRPRACAMYHCWARWTRGSISMPSGRPMSPWFCCPRPSMLRRFRARHRRLWPSGAPSWQPSHGAMIRRSFCRG